MSNEPRPVAVQDVAKMESIHPKYLKTISLLTRCCASRRRRRPRGSGRRPRRRGRCRRRRRRRGGGDRCHHSCDCSCCNQSNIRASIA